MHATLRLLDRTDVLSPALPRRLVGGGLSGCELACRKRRRKNGASRSRSRFELAELDRAIADDSTRGFIEVLTVPGKDKILDATIVGVHAGDLLAENVLAMKHGLGSKKILGTIHTYSTLSEANQYVAGTWRRAHAPEKLLAWVRRFHDWERT